MKAETTQAAGVMTTYSVLTAVSTTLKNLISFVKIVHIVLPTASEVRVKRTHLKCDCIVWV